MLPDEKQSCPRCGELFVCKSGSSGHCQCDRIELEPRLLQHLAGLYDTCLCMNCLAELKMRGSSFI